MRIPSRSSTTEAFPFDIEKIRAFLESFSQAVGTSAGFIGDAGQIITASYRASVCESFFKTDGEAVVPCRRESAELLRIIESGQPEVIHACEHGLSHAAAPVIVGGRRVASIFLGQFLLADADAGEVVRRAGRFGFDAEAFAAQLARAPRFTRAEIAAYLDVLVKACTLIAALGIGAADASKAAESARESARMLSEAERIADLGNWTWKVAEDSMTLSEGALRIFRLRPPARRESFGRFVERFHPADRAGFKAAVADALLGRSVRSVEHRIILPEGEERVVMERAEAVRGEGGAPPCVIGTVLDVTELARTRAELEGSEARYRNLAESIQDVVLIVDGEGLVEYANGASEALFAPLGPPLAGRPLAEALPEGLAPLARALIGRALAGEGAAKGEWMIARDGGGLAWLDAHAYPARGEGAAMLVARDVTELKRSEADALRRAEQMAALEEAGRAIAETYSLEDIYRHVERASAALLPGAATIFISLYDHEERRFTAVHAVQDGASVDVSTLPKVDLLPPGRGVQSEALHRRAPVIIDDLEERLAAMGGPAALVGADDGRAARSCVAVPMITRGRVIGVLQAQGYERGMFGAAEANLLAIAANSAAVAIENARLFAELQRKNEELAHRVVERTQHLRKEVAEKERAHAAFRGSETKYRALFENVADAIFIHDAGGRILEANETACRRLGYSRDELVGLSMAEIDFPDRAGGLELRTRRLMEAGKLLDTTVHVARDGRRLPVELSCSLFEYDGAPAVFSLARDIGERIEHERALRRSERSLSLALESAKAGVFQYSDDRGFDLDARLREIIGLEDEGGPVPAAELFARVDPADAGALRAVRDEIAGGARSFSCELRVLKGGSGRAWIKIDGLADPERSPQVVGMVQDIGQQKATEAELRAAKLAAEESSRAKTEFLSRMSHELRTPLNAILGFAQLFEINRKEPLSEKQQDRIKRIIDAGRHLLELINEILDISRIEAGRLSLQAESVCVGDAVREAVALSAPEAAKRGIRVVTEGVADADRAVADAQRLRQVLLNLFGNAIKYNRDGGSVRVWSERTGAGDVRVTVKDTGPGIPREKMHRLFQPFERLDAEREGIEGSGLGLAISKRLVELMGGAIGVDCPSEGGSAFWFEVPAAPGAEEAGAGGGEPAAGLEGLAGTVLYVEDNAANLRLVQEALEPWPAIRLEGAATGEEGLAKAAALAPDAVLLDLQLPGMSGQEVFAALQRAFPRTPVLIVSADASPSRIRFLKESGARAYLTKPLEMGAFFESLAAALGGEAGDVP